ncbi:MAG: tetratricopeptide repeat protein, partial [Xanthomonadales bacterium]|nr:tetratricopeptide repeat protein [Xanthomonadales bacterium]
MSTARLRYNAPDMNPTPTPGPQAAIHALLRDERFEEADRLLCGLQNPPLALLLIHSQVAQKLGDFPRMLQLAARAAERERDGFQAALRLVECQVYAGESAQALEGLRALRRKATKSPDMLHRIAKMYIHCARHDLARACHQDALRAQPDNADFMYDLATSCVAAGDFERAATLFDEVIRRQPDNWIAWQNRSNLRKQTPESNHVGELKAALHNLPQPGPDEVPLCYALAKEYEDLGDHRRSIKYLQMGAARRREMLSYRVSEDVATMRRIRQAFNAKLMGSAPEAPEQPGPIFVLGLPRSGTTLVDRILASHSQ